MRKIHNHEFFKPARQHLRHNMTKAEVLLWIQLKNGQLGFKFRRQQSIGSYIVDFYCPKVGLIIELDGGIHGEDSVVKNDSRKENFLKDNSFTVKRYTNDQIFFNLEFILEEIRHICENHNTTPFPLLKEEGTN